MCSSDLQDDDAEDLYDEIFDYLDAPKDEPIGYVFQYSDGALGSDIYYTPEEAVEYTEGEGIGVPVYRHHGIGGK